MKKKLVINRISLIVSILCINSIITDLSATPRLQSTHPKEVNQTKDNKSYWESSIPEDQGMDSTLLIQMFKKITEENLHIRSIIIVRNNRLVLESYIHPYTREILHNTKSASKSIVSTLVGIALREKWIKNLDQTVYDYFSNYFTNQTNTPPKKINLRHLLTMSSGLKVQEQTEDTEKIFNSINPIKTLLEFPMEANPGERFNYLTPLSLLMVEILKLSSGKSLPEIANKYVFNPMGIEAVLWKEVPPGYFFTDALMRPLDMAKFGVLFLNNGKWQGEQVVPVHWVEESTKNQIANQRDTEGPYGYWWWRSRSKDLFMALGWGGQGIYVWPDEHMVIVTTAADYEKAQDLVFDYIIPAVKSNVPLPPNPQNAKTLQKLIKHLQSGTGAVCPVAPGPIDTIKKINGITYRLEPNIAGLTSMTFLFNDNSCRLTLGTLKGTSEVEVGLDNVYRVSDSGRYGDKPAHNQLALKGYWKNTNTFSLDLHSISRPEQGILEIEFKGTELAITGRVIGTDIQFTIKSK